MKKYIGCILALLTASWLQATPLPDNMYFKAMKKEMDRSVKKLHRPGIPPLFYVAYKLENVRYGASAAASLGQSYPDIRRDDSLTAYAWVALGTPKKDSLGYRHDAYYTPSNYRPRREGDVSKSYAGIRQSLWALTDQAYIFAAETYQQKKAYEQQHETDEKNPLPDFIPQKQGFYVQEITPLPQLDENQLAQWARALSARGKDYPFLENLTVQIDVLQKDVYYLNNLGGFYQRSFPAMRLIYTARLRNQDGFKKNLREEYWLPAQWDEPIKTTFSERMDAFLSGLQDMYQAQPPEAYIGPVLLKSQAAGHFLADLFVKNMQQLNPVLSSEGEDDPSAGLFRSKVGMRTVSNAVELEDNPQLTAWNGVPVGGFMPIDDEGVPSQPLALTQKGTLRQLPRTSRPLDEKQPSNGHARMLNSFPREYLTNVVVQAVSPKSEEELEEALLEKCRALELEYCYILWDFPTSGEDKELFWAQRIYTQDGSRELVYGLQIADLTPRALRDIEQAADKAYVVHLFTHNWADMFPTQSVITPSLLVEELEFVPDHKKADKAPFVKKPL